MVWGSATVKQMLLEEVEEKIALPATTNARQDLDEPVALGLDQPVEIEVALYFHGAYYTMNAASESSSRFHF